MSKDENGDANGKSAAVVAAEFYKFCKLMREHMSIDEMHRIVEANGQDDSASDDGVVPQWYKCTTSNFGSIQCYLVCAHAQAHVMHMPIINENVSCICPSSL